MQPALLSVWVRSVHYRMFNLQHIKRERRERVGREEREREITIVYYWGIL